MLITFHKKENKLTDYSDAQGEIRVFRNIFGQTELNEKIKYAQHLTFWTTNLYGIHNAIKSS